MLSPMGITVIIEEDLLHSAEQATHIRDRTLLVEEGLRALCRLGQRAPFDFDATLAAAADLPDLTEESLDNLRREINRPLPSPW